MVRRAHYTYKSGRKDIMMFEMASPRLHGVQDALHI